jgi:hypothetical protein
MIWNLWGTWHHYQPPLLSLSICLLFLYMITVFMMPLCSKFLIKWWLTCPETYCLCRYAHCFYRCSLYLYMVIIFIYAHCLNICSLSLHMLTVFTYVHCFDICSLFLYMVTEFIYAHWVYIRSLILHMLTVLICDHCFYICSVSLHMLTVFIYAHCFYICSLSLYMLTVFRYVHCVYMRSLSLDMLTVFICGHCFYICPLSLHMLIVLIYAHWVTYAHCFDICSLFWSLSLFLYMRSLGVSSWLLSGSVDHLWSNSFFAPTSTLSSLPYLASDEIVQLQKLFGIWADDLKLVRNLASLPNAPTIFVDMLTVFMMPLWSKFLIKWWLICSETYCLYRCSLFL